MKKLLLGLTMALCGLFAVNSFADTPSTQTPVNNNNVPCYQQVPCAPAPCYNQVPCAQPVAPQKTDSLQYCNPAPCAPVPCDTVNCAPAPCVPAPCYQPAQQSNTQNTVPSTPVPCYGGC